MIEYEILVKHQYKNKYVILLIKKKKKKKKKKSDFRAVFIVHASGVNNHLLTENITLKS